MLSSSAFEMYPAFVSVFLYLSAVISLYKAFARMYPRIDRYADTRDTTDTRDTINTEIQKIQYFSLILILLGLVEVVAKSVLFFQYLEPLPEPIASAFDGRSFEIQGLRNFGRR